MNLITNYLFDNLSRKILIYGFWGMACGLFIGFSVCAQEQENVPVVQKLSAGNDELLAEEEISSEKIDDGGVSQETRAGSDEKKQEDILAEEEKPIEKSDPAEEKIPVIIDADQINYFHGEGKISAKGNVKLSHKNMELFCNEAEYNANSYIAHIKGKLKVVKKEIDDTVKVEEKSDEEKETDTGKEMKGEKEEKIIDENVKISTLYGEDIVFDFNTELAQITNLKLEDPPIYGKAQIGERFGYEKYLFRKGGYVTTCDLEKPHYRMVSNHIVIYPQDRVIMRNMIFKVGQLPLAYLPYVSYSLKDKYFPVQVVPGKDKELGGCFVLNSVRYDLNEDNRGKLHVDWYDKRKLGAGITHKSDYDWLGESLTKYYAIQDEAYDLELREDMFARYPERRDTLPKYLEDDRYKMQFSHKWIPMEKLSIKTEFNKFSDPNFMKDFFYQEYNIEANPLTYNLIDYSFSNSSLAMLNQKRANHYSSQVEYLPQLEYNFFRQNLGESDFYLESTEAFGNLDSKTAHSDIDSDVVRLYSHNTLSYDKKIKWLNINPYAGGYSNIYSKNLFGEEGLWRGAFETGTDLNTKLYKIFAADFNLLGKEIKLMRHVVTPNVTYAYKHDPTVPNAHILSFDGKDSLSRAESVVFTLGNKLQAKTKENSVWDFLYFSPAVTYQIHPEGEESSFTTVNTSLEVYPVEGISLKAGKTYTVSERRITSVNVDLKFSDTNIDINKESRYDIALGHRYTKHSSTQGTFDLQWQVIPKIRFKNYMRYEYNTEDLLERYFGIRLDLHCWWLDLGTRVDKQREGINNYSFWMVFTIKAFPDMEITFDEGYKGAKRRY